MNTRSLFFFVMSTAVGLGVVPPAHADEAAADTGHIVIPAIPGVPKIFLPDIGVSGDLAVMRDNLRKSDPRYDRSAQQPQLRDGQIVLFSPIDPYTNAQLTADFPHEGDANIEEAWVYFNKLPGSSALRVGKFIPEFGLINSLDTFQLPMVDRPNALGNFLSPDGLNGTGLAWNAYIPNPWDWNVKADLDAIDGKTLGGSGDTLDLAYLATLDYSRDLFTSGSLQLGSSVAQGPSPYGRSETLVEPFIQFILAPTQRKIWTWSTEGIVANRHGLGDDNVKSGAYSFLDYNFALRYHVGWLLDWADQPAAPYGHQLSFGPNATWFLSDNMRFRAQYSHTTALAAYRPEEKVTLQVTFSLGNLKQLD